MNLAITRGDYRRFQLTFTLDQSPVDLTTIGSITLRAYNALTDTTIVQSTVDGSIAVQSPASAGIALWTCQPAVTLVCPNQTLSFTARVVLVDVFGNPSTTDAGTIAVAAGP